MSRLKKLQQLQWLNKEELSTLQQEYLKNLLLHAYQHVPYYREILQKAGVIQNIKNNIYINLNNFSQIPLLDKSIIRDNYERLKSDDLKSRKWYENTSGGSTGEPVRFVQDKNYHDTLLSVKMLDDLWSGYKIGDRKIILWGSERDLLIGREKFRTLVGRWLRNEICLNAFRITPENMYSYIKYINEFKPVQILAYVASLYEMACFIDRKKINVYSPKSIMVSAGVLHEHMRETIEKIFKAPVFNRYGSREVGDIACECDRHQGLHISPFTHYVEILREDGSPAEQGELGEIIVTLFANYAMPLIRYRIGDIGAWSEKACTCGREWPMLKYVSGKMWDIFRTKDGTQAHGEFFIRIFYFQDWIKKFQVIQEDFDFIRVLIVPDRSKEIQKIYSKEIYMITNKIRFVMGQECKVQFDFVEDIKPLASGKYHYIVSKV